jgi:hypothetical protein
MLGKFIRCTNSGKLSVHGTSSSFPAGGEVSCTGHCIYATLALQKSLFGVTITMVGSVSLVAWMGVSASISAGTLAAVFLAEMLYNNMHISACKFIALIIIMLLLLVTVQVSY